jgi:excisionase family DNA binding protein
MDTVDSGIGDLPAMLRMSDVQRFLGLSRPTTYELVHRRGFPAVRFGRVIRVPRDAFLAWIACQVAEGSDGRFAHKD